MENKMNIVLLSGGSGKRLWPLSNEIRSKQFIQLFKTKEGIYESMVQRVFRQMKEVDENADITITTSKSQLSAIHNQLGDKLSICVEPCRRDTFAAITLAAAYLRDVKGIGEEESVIVCPVDSYVENEYFQALRELAEIVQKQDVNLALMGMEPNSPSEKYGYIIPENQEKISKVKAFQEKPDRKTAEKYIKQGALWNGGVFAFRLGYLLAKAHEKIQFADYDDLYDQFANVEKISFDYAVVEQEKHLAVMRFCGQWKDLGTWNSLTQEMEDTIVGDAQASDDCENVHVINELNLPILCMGLKDMVVSASAEGILVSDKEHADQIKPYVDQIRQQTMFAEKSWGSFRVIDAEDESMTIKVTLNPGHEMNYHSHEFRDEVWTIISGTGKTIVDGMEETVRVGDVITMQAGCRHMIVAKTELKLIEVQLGKEITVHDKQKYERPL